MKNHTLTKATIGLTLGSALILAGCTAQDGGSDELGGYDMSDPTQDGANGGIDDDAQVGSADITFAQMMLPHHEQALEMSQIMLDKDGVDPAVVDLATRIEAAQEPEIATMEGFLDEWGAETMSDHSQHDMEGMLSDEQIQELKDADAETASRLYLEGMIAHHEGAVDMAETELADGENPEAQQLAQEIIDAQQAEIAEMQELLATL